MGANVSGANVYMDIGRDLIVMSRQNSTTSSQQSFNASITFTFGPDGPVPTAATLGGGFGNGTRFWTDAPTTIVAGSTKDLNGNAISGVRGGVMDITVGRTTALAGSGLWSLTDDPAKLTLDTGNFIFSDYNDIDKARSITGQVSLNFQDIAKNDLRGSYSYRNVTGLTFATVGAGTIITRNAPDQSLFLLNRERGNMQRLMSSELIDFKLSGVNLNQVVSEKSILPVALSRPKAEREIMAQSRIARRHQKCLLSGSRKVRLYD